MKRIRLLAIILSLVVMTGLLCATMCYGATAVPTDVITASNSVVRVLAEYADGYATGSGFVVSNDGTDTYIATNYHVIEGNPYSISIWVDENNTISAEIAAYSDQKDMAVLKLNQVTKLTPLQIAPATVNKGEAVYAIGFPGSADYLSDKEAHSSEETTITDGIVSAIREATISDYGAAVEMVQNNAAINPGNSGGPLVNMSGVVVGINTYQVRNSQGIFGAISSSELAAFLKIKGIPFSLETEDAGGMPILYISLAAGVIIIVLVVVILIAHQRKKRKTHAGERAKKMKRKSLPPESTQITLREYLRRVQRVLTAEEAVSLLMPSLLKMRDLHRDGKVHLQITPDTIVVSENKSSLNDPTEDESARYLSGFAAPEVYADKGGIRADVYSICAVLYYAVTGRVPPNALSRNGGLAFCGESNAIIDDEEIISGSHTGNSDGEGSNAGSLEYESPEIVQDPDDIGLSQPNDNTACTIPTGICETLDLGMALSEEERICDAQDLIYRLSAFNTGAVAPILEQEPELEEYKENSPKRGRGKRWGRGIVITLGSLVALAVICCGAYYWSYRTALKDAENQNFSTALKHLYLPAITELHDPDLIRYVDAGVKYENLEYSKAADAFSDLDSYLDSENLRSESLYRLASQRADNNDFDGAKWIFKSLADKNYSDAASKLLETRYRQGMYALYNEHDYFGALVIFEALEKEKYSKASDAIQATYYEWGCALAEEKKYEDAYDTFQNIPRYSDVSDYLELLTDILYYEGQEAYWAEDDSTAIKLFTKISPYSRSMDYIALIRCRSPFTAYLSGYEDFFTTSEKVEVLKSLFYFEDAAELLLSGDDATFEFLLGNWRTSGGYYWNMSVSTSDKYSYWNNYSLPWVNGNSFYIDDGMYYVTTSQGDKPCWRMTLITPNSMEMYCYSNGNTYTLNRTS